MSTSKHSKWTHTHTLSLSHKLIVKSQSWLAHSIFAMLGYHKHYCLLITNTPRTISKHPKLTLTLTSHPELPANTKANSLFFSLFRKLIVKLSCSQHLCETGLSYAQANQKTWMLCTRQSMQVYHCLWGRQPVNRTSVGVCFHSNQQQTSHWGVADWGSELTGTAALSNQPAQITGTEAEPQQIVAQRLLSCLQYHVP